MDRYDLTDEEITEAKAIIFAEAAYDEMVDDPDFAIAAREWVDSL